MLCLDVLNRLDMLAERLWGVAKEAWVQAGPLPHGVLGDRVASSPGDVEDVAGPDLQREETVRAREDSKSGGSSNANNNSGDGGSGANRRQQD